MELPAALPLLYKNNKTDGTGASWRQSPSSKNDKKVNIVRPNNLLSAEGDLFIPFLRIKPYAVHYSGQGPKQPAQTRFPTNTKGGV